MPQAEFWIVLTQVRRYVLSIQYSVSHRIGNPVWIYNRTNHFFHTKVSSHYVLDNTIWLLLLYSHIGLVYIRAQYLGCQLRQWPPLPLLGPIGPEFRWPLHPLEAHLVETILWRGVLLLRKQTHISYTQCARYSQILYQ